ncbi:hypothetical protein [Streptomyces sp. NPDC056387]|uniref:hypothetical protein n=1 Tax=Streptomyces sp. NPDC056387 TaxID=3345803 RepID=UPI0035DF8EF4
MPSHEQARPIAPQGDPHSPQLGDYAMPKTVVVSLRHSLVQMPRERDVRADAVAPGPVLACDQASCTTGDVVNGAGGAPFP